MRLPFDGGPLALFTLLVVGVTAVAWGLARRSAPTELPHPEGWALAGRGLGPVGMAMLLGGTTYTAYTLVAVPGLTFATGGLGLYSLVYTILFTPAALVVLPLMHQLARRHGLVTAADVTRARHGSHALALAVTITGVVAAMPYLALQVVGLHAALRALDVQPTSLVGVTGVVLVLAVLVTVVLPDGLRVCMRVASFKAVLLAVMLAATLVLVARRTSGPGEVFRDSSLRLARHQVPLIPPDDTYSAYASLALGCVLAQLMYPQTFTVALAAGSADTVRRSVLALPLWTLGLGLFAYLGLAALTLGVHTPEGHAEMAVPTLLDRLVPPWASGLLLGALAIGALLPAAVIAIGMATTIARNVYAEYFNPTATPKHEVRVARFAAAVITLGALVFAFLLQPQDAVNLHLLGGVWIIQVFPAVGLGAVTRWFHHRALLAGWAAGMVSGTAVAVAHGFSSVVGIGFGQVHLAVYVAVAALAVNLAVATALTPLLDRAGVPRGPDSLAADATLPRRSSRFAVRVD
ncbi:sodium:solute symporter family protein [Streptomyces rubradiris]|uniref:Sodium:solute symporter n=1 Tax=Streptomyces rubradiris TaxID=285531 RepID=A0ABQ3RF25_STRRR|nr:sodium:solute symporter [Streptomyces rubradiris]GHG97565.1 sodium:solute symporter [Streptomyces rubradiris]GHI54431.1 sodium:solute symporter [Streptomyces rubradiris]